MCALKKHKLIIEEVKILKEMRHKNIVRYIGIQEHKHKDSIGIICEYVSGRFVYSKKGEGFFLKLLTIVLTRGIFVAVD